MAGKLAAMEVESVVFFFFLDINENGSCIVVGLLEVGRSERGS